MPTTEIENNIFDESIKILFDCYLHQLKMSWLDKQAIDGCKNMDQFHSCDGVEFIDKNIELKKIVSSVSDEIKNGMSMDDFLLFHGTDILSDFLYVDSCLILSIGHYLHSKWLFDNKMGRVNILTNISTAINYIGKFAGTNEFKMLNEEYFSYFKEVKESASKGGNKRNERYVPIKNKIIELIKSEKPKAGWKDYEEFISLMGNTLIQFNRDNGHIMSEGSMLTTVKKWLKNDADMVAPVFSANGISGLTSD